MNFCDEEFHVALSAHRRILTIALPRMEAAGVCRTSHSLLGGHSGYLSSTQASPVLPGYTFVSLHCGMTLFSASNAEQSIRVL